MVLNQPSKHHRRFGPHWRGPHQLTTVARGSSVGDARKAGVVWMHNWKEQSKNAPNCIQRKAAYLSYRFAQSYGLT